MNDCYIITCEHAGNDIPEKYQPLFENQGQVLNSHSGWDPGSLDIAKFLAENLLAPIYFQTESRLLVELNRSVNHHQLFSIYTRNLNVVEQQELLLNYYFPYRDQVEQEIMGKIQEGFRVIHLSIHTFTPVWMGRKRKTDIGILFDPDREEEKKWAEQFQKTLQDDLTGFEISHNEPYLGIDDGFTTYLRKQLNTPAYLGIELEINQKYVGTSVLKIMKSALLNGIRTMDLKDKGCIQ